MRRIVLTFGLIGGAIISIMMALGVALLDRIGLDAGEALGYTSMVLAFLMVFFGIRSFRDNVAGGTIGFGRAFTVGILITLVTSACYVATWEVIYYTGMAGDFGAEYAALTLDKARADGATEAEVAKQAADMARFVEMYRNPFVNVAFTFMEILPVGIVMTLVSAGILRRPRRSAAAGASLGGASVVA